MTPRQSIFKQSDVTRACKAVVSAGLPVGRVEIDREGKIVVVILGAASQAEKNDWD